MSNISCSLSIKVMGREDKVLALVLWVFLKAHFYFYVFSKCSTMYIYIIVDYLRTWAWKPSPYSDSHGNLSQLSHLGAMCVS